MVALLTYLLKRSPFVRSPLCEAAFTWDFDKTLKTQADAKWDWCRGLSLCAPNVCHGKTYHPVALPQASSSCHDVILLDD